MKPHHYDTIISFNDYYSSRLADASTGNNFTCTCVPGFEGPLCDIPFCEITPCDNGGLCLTTGAVSGLQMEYSTDQLFIETFSLGTDVQM